MDNILAANNKQINVLIVIGSLNKIILKDTNTTIPIPNPIRRDGQSCPSKWFTKLSTELIYNQVVGIADSNIIIGYLSNHPYFMFPCICRKDNTWPNIPKTNPLNKLFNI